MWTRIGVVTTALLGIIGVAAAIGIDPPPYATKEEVVKLAGEVKKSYEGWEANRHDILNNQRRYWQSELRNARKELARNPNSLSAQKWRQEAESALKDIQAQRQRLYGK